MKIAILGAGNGGQAMAADLSLVGHEVSLYSKFEKELKPIVDQGGIKITGAAHTGFAKLSKVTANMQEAIEDVRVVMVVVPAFAHKPLIEEFAEYLEDNQIVLFNPGNYGSIECKSILESKGIKTNAILADATTLIYACRLKRPAEVDVHGLKTVVPIAALPARRNEAALRVLKTVFPQFSEATNVLEPSLNNMNAVGHPAIALLNAGRIEYTKGGFFFYKEGVTASVAKVMAAVDRDRLSVMRALGLKETAQVEWIRTWYGMKGELTYQQFFTECKAYQTSRAPSDLGYRYLNEDVPYGLVPMTSFGTQLGVSTPTIDAIIEIASTVSEKDYKKEGMTAEKLGLGGLSAEEINKKVN